MAKSRKRSHGTGSIFKRSTKGCWFASWYDHDGKRIERSTRTTDKAAAEHILNKHVANAALRREGVIDPRKDRQDGEGRRPLADHIHNYITHCRHAGQDEHYVNQKKSHLERLREETGCTRLSGLTADALECHLRALKDAGLSAPGP